MFNCQFMRNTSTYTISLSIQVWFLSNFPKVSSWFHVASSLSTSFIHNGFMTSEILPDEMVVRRVEFFKLSECLEGNGSSRTE